MTLRVVLRFANGYLDNAESLAESLQIPLLSDQQGGNDQSCSDFVGNDPVSNNLAFLTDVDFELWLSNEGLVLRELSVQGQGKARFKNKFPNKLKNNPKVDIRCDFIAGELRHRRLYGGGKNQMILKATGLNSGPNKYKPSVMDLTAGLGRDSFVLATAGATVTMFERQPVVAALLDDGLRRLRSYGDEQELAIAQRLILHHGDSLDCLPAISEQDTPDVIYIDPMFPERGKTAKVKKAMAFFHQLVGNDTDGSALLPLALSTARYRVVVKRPRHAPPLADMQPGLSFEGKSIRFDIYPLKKLPV